MLITENLTSSCCFVQLSPLSLSLRPDIMDSQGTLTLESLWSLCTTNTWEAVSGETSARWLGFGYGSTTHNSQSSLLCLIFLPVKWVAVKIKCVNICERLKDLDLSLLCKEVFAVTIITSHVLGAA